jgi:hypothetical protein
MDTFIKKLVEIPINALELVTWTQLYCFKPNSLLEDFLLIHKCPAPAVFHGIQILHNIRYIIIHLGYYDIKNIDTFPKDTFLQKALGCYAWTPADLKRRVMDQLIPLKNRPNQTIYDRLTGNYFHYVAVVEIPKALRPLFKQVFKKSVGRHRRTFANVLALFQQVLAHDRWCCARIGSTPTIKVKRDNLIPILGGRVIAHCERVERLAKFLVFVSDCPTYHAAGDYVD